MKLRREQRQRPAVLSLLLLVLSVSIPMMAGQPAEPAAPPFDEAPKLISGELPEPTPEAREARLEGEVVSRSASTKRARSSSSGSSGDCLSA